jgi:cytoskeletal protein CcmA (bactofilin family)
VLRRPDVVMQPETKPDDLTDNLDVPESADEGTPEMFGRKKDDPEGKNVDSEVSQPDPPGEDAPASLPLRVRDRAPMSPPIRTPVARPEPVRRTPDVHNAAGRRLDRLDRPGGGADSEGKKLVVGREIALNGQINSCDKLIVEGRVEANMSDCREIEIAESGTFKGEAEIEMADISGTFEGSLIARQLLIVRASGRITGKVRFGQLEIERGGEIIGDVQVHSPSDSREPSPIRSAETPAE